MQMTASNGTHRPFDRRDSALVLAHVLFAFAALLIGGIAGLLQGLVRGGMVTLPANIGYYQLLTAHGVLMALIFTTFFIMGFIYAGLAKTLGGHLLDSARRLGWAGFAIMGLGTVLGTIMILLNRATVLYTFYAPMKADSLFYIALVLIVVGSWISGAGMIRNYSYWKKTHKGQTSPLFATFEMAGRKRGGTGLFGWLRKLPWKDARFFAPFMGMVIFIPAGAGGLVNASNQMNAVVHNTLFVTGHFHLTVASSVALTFFGIAYWLIPAVTGRKLTAKLHRWGIIQTIVWAARRSFRSPKRKRMRRLRLVTSSAGASGSGLPSRLS